MQTIQGDGFVVLRNDCTDFVIVTAITYPAAKQLAPPSGAPPLTAHWSDGYKMWHSVKEFDRTVRLCDQLRDLTARREGVAEYNRLTESIHEDHFANPPVALRAVGQGEGKELPWAQSFANRNYRTYMEYREFDPATGKLIKQSRNVIPETVEMRLREARKQVAAKFGAVKWESRDTMEVLNPTTETYERRTTEAFKVKQGYRLTLFEDKFSDSPKQRRLAHDEHVAALERVGEEPEPAASTRELRDAGINKGLEARIRAILGLK